MLETELKYNLSNLETQAAKLEQARKAFIDAKHDQAIAARTTEMRRLDEEKDRLNQTVRTLSLQAESRARLELKRGELNRKRGDIDVT
jgi:DNA repair protein RAD50